MSTAATMTNAAATITINGRELRIRALRDKDWGEIERWAQLRRVRVARELADEAVKAGSMNEAQANRQMDRAFDAAQSWGMLSPDWLATITTREGMLKVCAVALRIEQPHITDAEVEALLEKPSDRLACYRAAMDLVTLDAGASSKKADSPEGSPPSQ